jgi:hypothetical protein
MKKTKSPYRNIDQRNLLFIAEQKENMYIYLQQQLQVASIFSIHVATQGDK